MTSAVLRVVSDDAHVWYAWGQDLLSPAQDLTECREGVPADLQKQAAEALRELLFGISDGPALDPTPVRLPSNPDELANLKSELQQNRLQIRELEAIRFS